VTPEAQEALDKLNALLTRAPILVPPAEKEPLLLYIAATTQVVSAAIGVPNSIITDNGTQLTGKKFLRFCDDHHIHVDWAAVVHPQTNGQVKRANNMILQGLKPRIFNRLNKFGRRWVAELPMVL
jgi:transposase InsO family protein